MTDEPILPIDDIQGHLLPGFASLYNYLIGLEITDKDRFAGIIREQIDLLCTTEIIQRKREMRKSHYIMHNSRISDDDLLMAHAISGSGFRKLGIDLSGFVDEKLSEGMYLNAAGLHDRANSKSDPANWKFGTPDKPLDYLIILACDDREKIIEQMQRIVEEFVHCARLTYSELGARLPNEIEHFGFKDGISQPAIRGRTDEHNYLSTRTISPEDSRSDAYAKPGVPLVWPGQFVFGYASQSGNPVLPGPVRKAVPAWSENGSFLVLRRLNQDVKLFRKAMKKLSDDINSQYDLDITSEQIAARCVGRWPDGTPVSLTPDSPDQEIAGDIDRINNFLFTKDTPECEITSRGITRTLPPAAGDSQGLRCPHFAHIRKVNPRDDTTDIGTDKTPRKLLLRRGIPFGDLYDDGNEEDERGLLFMAYQTSIKNQFEFLQKNWVNDLTKPSISGQDFIIGQDYSGRKLARFQLDGKEVSVINEDEYIFTTGGEYLFTPGITGLKKLMDIALAD